MTWFKVGRNKVINTNKEGSVKEKIKISQELLHSLQVLTKAWETGEIEKIGNLFAPLPAIEFSMFAPKYSVAVLQADLKDHGSDQYSNFEVHDHFCHAEGDEAVQSASMTGRIEADKKAPYIFSGRFVNKLVKVNDAWKIKELHFDLTDDNTVRKEWVDQSIRTDEVVGKAIPENWIPIMKEVSVYENCQLPKIGIELEGKLLLERSEIGSDEERIRELFYRYELALDTCSLKLLESLLADEVSIELPLAGTYTDKAKLISGAARFWFTLGARLHHIVVNDNIKVSEKSAEAEFKCQSAGFINLTYKVSFVKSDGCWQIKAVKIEKY